ASLRGVPRQPYRRRLPDGREPAVSCSGAVRRMLNSTAEANRLPDQKTVEALYRFERNRIVGTTIGSYLALLLIRHDIVLLSPFIGRCKPALAEKGDPVGIDGRAADERSGKGPSVDTSNGERPAIRWCAAQHVVASNQREANANAAGGWI